MIEIGLIVVYGPPCSGKSTYVNTKLGKKDVRFDYDLLMQSISTRKSHEYSDDHLPYVMDFREVIIKKSTKAKGIKDTYVIATRITDKLKAELKDKNPTYKLIDTTKEQCLKYLKQDKTRKDKKFWRKKINDWFEWHEEYKKESADDSERGETMDKTETRELITNEIEIREDDDGNRTISGYAVKWEKKSHVLGYFMKFREQFKKGSFADSLNDGDQRFLWSHDSAKVLGRIKNNTLRLKEDDVGLHFELDLPNTTLGNDTYESIRRGDVDGVSFGFNNPEDHVEEFDDDIPLRTIKKANLIEVSAVAFPAYPDSEVAARGFDRMKEYSDDLKEYQDEQAAKIKMLIELGGN